MGFEQLGEGMICNICFHNKATKFYKNFVYSTEYEADGEFVRFETLIKLIKKAFSGAIEE